MDEDDDLRIKVRSYSIFKICNMHLLKLFKFKLLKANIATCLEELILDRAPSFFTSYLCYHFGIGWYNMSTC